MSDAQSADLTKLTVDLLSAYCSSNSVAVEDLAGLIQSTRAALAATTSGAEDLKAEEPVHTPAVSIRKSLANPDHLISLIDGKPYKTLKRHLASHGLTIADYRDRYKLPADYPTVAPAYSQVRRATASRIGLGRRPATAASATAEAAPTMENAAVTPDAPVSTSKRKVKTTKAKAGAAPSSKAQAKPRAGKANPGEKAQAPTALENPMGSASSVAETKPALGASVNIATKPTDGPAPPIIDVVQPAPKPRAKLKIAIPTA